MFKMKSIFVNKESGLKMKNTYTMFLIRYKIIGYLFNGIVFINILQVTRSGYEKQLKDFPN